jgi:hypothetical protein
MTAGNPATCEIVGGHRPPLQCTVLIMYTFRMSWSFRGLVLSLAMVWTIAPQLACFMPDEVLTEAEKECCKEMMQACGGMNMTHDCCRTVVRADVGIIAKSIRNSVPEFSVAGGPDESAAVWTSASHGLFFLTTHAPPPDRETASLILRI